MSSPCNTCAFRAGCITHDKEPHNALKGEICALSGVPFFCHYDQNHVDRHMAMSCSGCAAEASTLTERTLNSAYL
jgi:hypothetical protein